MNIIRAKRNKKNTADKGKGPRVMLFDFSDLDDDLLIDELMRTEDVVAKCWVKGLEGISWRIQTEYLESLKAEVLKRCGGKGEELHE